MRIIKSKRLRDVITSDEARFWKVLSRNIYLNTDRIELDKRLLKNYYLGRGYYDVQVLSTSAEITNKDNIELTSIFKPYNTINESEDKQELFGMEIDCKRFLYKDNSINGVICKKVIF